MKSDDSNIDERGLERLCRTRLKEAREARGIHPSELALYVYNSQSAYYDLENCDGEIFMNLELHELDRLTAALGKRPIDLFASRPTEHVITPEDLCRRIKVYLAEKQMPVNAFEEAVTWEIGPGLADSSEILNWNIDCLRCVCSEIGVNWLEALPA